MKNKALFILILLIVVCTERLEKIFYIGFFDLYPARVAFLILLSFFNLNLFLSHASKETRKIGKIYLIYILFVFLSIFKSPDILQSFKKWLDTFTLISFIFLTYTFLTRSTRTISAERLNKILLKNLKLMVLVVFVAGLFLYRTINEGDLEQRTFLGISFYRRISLFRDPNFFSCFLIVSFFLIYFSKISNKRFYLFIIAVSIFLSGSKGGIAALILTLLLYYRKNVPILKSTFFLYTTLACTLAGFLLLIMYPYQGINFLVKSPFFDADIGAETILPRILVWQSGMAAFLHDPLLGIGPGNIVNISKSSNIAGLLIHMESSGFYGLGSEKIDKLATHSSYLELLFESGIFAFAANIALLYTIAKQLLKYSRINRGMFLGFTLAFISFYLSTLFLSYNTYYMSFLTGFYLFLIDKYSKEIKTENLRKISLEYE